MAISRYIAISLALLSLLALNAHRVSAQARGSFDEEGVIETVKSQLMQMSGEAGSLRAFCTENNIKGQFVFDLTIEGKGNVLTVFLVSSTTEEVQAKNSLKDKLYSIRFENVKIPKKERVKFRHTLNF